MMKIKMWLKPLVLVLLWIPMVVSAGTGVVWLGSQVNQDGSNSLPSDIATSFQSTSEALRAYRITGQLPPAGVSEQLSFINGVISQNTEYLSRKIISNANAGNAVSSSVAALLTHQNQDGGFGDQSGYPSTVIDTAFALEALAISGNTSGLATGYGVSYLFGKQAADGSWSDIEGKPSVYTSSLAIQALTQYRFVYSSASIVIDKGVSYLLGVRDPSSQWGEFYLTAQALIAILPNIENTQSLQPAIDYFNSVTHDLTDGVSGDVYMTALALRAAKLIQSSTADPTLGGLSGTVIDAQTSLPISNVSVALSGPASRSALTNTYGMFEFFQLPAGDYVLELTLTDYMPVTATVSIKQGETVALGATPMSKVMTSTTGTILGVFTNANTGAALPGVTVSVLETGQSAITDEAGRYQISNVPSGSATIQAKKNGYSTATASTTISPGGLVVFTSALMPGEVSVTAIAGHVIEASSGLPVVGAYVSLTGATTASAISDENGDYRIEGLNPGALSIEVSAPGYDLVAASTTVYENNIISFSPRMYAAGSTPVGGNSASIIGEIVDAATNLPVNGAAITAVFGTTPYATVSNLSGVFAISGLTDYAGEIQISADGYSVSILNVVLNPLGITDLGRIRLSRLNVGQLLPDLIVNNVDATSSSNDPETHAVTGSVSALIENRGVATVGDSVELLAFFDVDNDDSYVTGTDVFLGKSKPVAEIYPGNSAQVSIQVSGYLSFRDAPIKVWVDSAQAIVETDDTNNVGSTIKYCLLPDITVSALHVTTQPLSLKVRVGNAGSVASPDQAQVAFYEGNPSGSGVPLGTMNIPSLASGTYTDIQLDNLVINGGIELFAVVDPANSISECGEANNQVSVAGPDLHPDLTPIAMDFSGVVKDIQNLTVTGNLSVTVSNKGTLDVPAGVDVLAFYDDNMDGVYEPNIDHKLGRSLTRSIIGMGGSELVTVPISGNLPFRDAPIAIYIDNWNSVVEQSENNNYLSSYASCRGIPSGVGTFNPVVKYRALPGKRIIATTAVASLNDDNGDGVVNKSDIPDIIFPVVTGTQFSGGVIKAISGDDGRELFTTTQSQPVATIGDIAVGDIDNDGLVEIVSAHYGGDRLLAFENTGELKWISDIDVLPGRRDSGGSVSIANLDGQGLPEIVVGASVYDASGHLLADGRDIGGGVGYKLYTTTSIVADIDMDGKPEIIAGKTVYGFENGALYIKWARNDLSDGFVGVADFDGDGYPEIVLVGNGVVYLLNHDGSDSLSWRSPGVGVAIPGGGEGGAPTIADFDGDGVPEVGVAGANYYVVFDSDGTVLWSSATRDASSRITGSTSFDFEGDGTSEIVYRDERFLRIYRGTDGYKLYEKPMWSGTATEYPVVVDIDNDNHAEIVISSDNLYGGSSEYTGVYVIEDANDSWAPTRNIWNQHSYHIDNINDDGTIPAVEKKSWESHNTYRLNTFPDRDPLGMPDLTVSLLKVIDNGYGNSLSISARIGNGGAVATQGQASVTFYDGDPVNGGTLLGSLSTGALGKGEYRDIRLDGITGISGTKNIYAVVDSDDAYLECNESNNVASVAPGVSITGVITVGTSLPDYGPNSLVVLGGDIQNTGALKGNYIAKLQIEDPSGVVVVDFPLHTVSGVGAGATVHVENNWNTGSILAGTYILRGVLSLEDGTQLSISTASFSISNGDASSAVATVRVTTDLPVYHTTATVQLQNLVRNTSVNTLVENVLLKVFVASPTGIQVFSTNKSLGQLGLSAQRSVSIPYAYTSAAVGGYTVTSEVWDSVNDILLSSDLTQYSVENDLNIALQGNVSAALTELYVGDDQTCTSVVTNTGSLSLTSISLRNILVDLGQQVAVNEQNYGASLAINVAVTKDLPISTDALSPGQYSCVLQAEIGGDWQTLANTIFKILKNPNTAPVADAGFDLHVSLGETVRLDGSGSTDLDGNKLTYRWLQIGAPMASSSVLSDTTAVMPTIVVDALGSYVFQLIVNDGTVDSDFDTVIINVGNVAPVADAGPDRHVNQGQSVTLNGTGSTDADGDVLSFQWSIIGAPVGSYATLSDPSALMPSINIDLDGSYTLQLIVKDQQLQSMPDTVTLSTYNSAPVADAGKDRKISVGSTITLDGTKSTDADGDLLTYRWSLINAPSGSVAHLTDETTATPAITFDKSGLYIAQLIVNDGAVDSEPDTVVLNVSNVRPVANAGPDQIISAGKLVTLSGLASYDADNDPLTYQWNLTTLPTGASPLLSNATSATASYYGYLAGQYVAQLIVEDGKLTSKPDTALITVVDDVGPVTSNVIATPNPVDVHTGITFTAKVDDSKTGGATIQSAEFRINDGFYQPMYAEDGYFDGVSEQVYKTLPSFNYSEVYHICVRGTDELGNTGEEDCTLLAVYDPVGGFVTGGGWINSPAGACQLTSACVTAMGKANFGFVSKYKPGATVPTGNTNFVFKSGEIHFQSDSYEWLVVSGAKAMYKGTGTINGGGNYGFQINAIDEALTASANQDMFRIKIWDKNDGGRIVYDNEMGKDANGDPTTAISGGSIVIHKE